MKLKELTNEEFKNFIKNYNLKSIYQTPQYGFVMNEENYDSIFLGLIEDNNILAASLILINKNNKAKYAYAPRGFLIDYNNFELLKIFTTEIKKYLGKRNVMAIKIAPIIIKRTYDIKYKSISNNGNYDNIFNNLKKLGYYHFGYQNYFEGLKPRFEAIIDIDNPYYLLFKNIKKEFRTKIRSAEKNGIKVYKGNSNDLNNLYLQTKNKYPRELEYFKNCYRFYKKDNLIELYYTKLDTAKYLKYISKKYTSQEELCNKLDKELVNNKNILKEKMSNDLLLHKYKNSLIYATRLLNKFPEGIITSSILITKNQNSIYMMMDGYDPKYKRLNSKHLLIWKLIEKYSKEGYKEFNLGGITSPEVDDNLYKGLNEFKLNFNAKVIEYAGDFELITNKSLYFMYKSSLKAKKVLKNH